MIKLAMNTGLLFIMLVLSNCVQPKEQNNTQIPLYNISISERADSLNVLYEKIQQATEEKSKSHYQFLFFKIFPDKFQMLDSLYGYEEESGPSILYDQAVNHIIEVFFKLDKIPKEVFTRKVIELSFYGTWEADAINYFQHGVRKNTKGNIELYCRLLSDYSEDELLSFWHFHFDGPHPENHQDYYESLHEKAKIFDPSIAKIMRQAYHELLANHDGHGH